MITASTAASLSKLPYAESTPEGDLEYAKQYAFAIICYEAIKGNTDAILYYNKNLFPILRAEGFKVEKYTKLENRMIISWGNVIAA